MKRITLVVFGWPLLLAAAQAATNAPPTWPGDHVFIPNTKIDPSSSLKLGSMEVEFEKTTLKMVSSAIGRGQLSSQGDASESVTWLCYTINAEKSVQRLWLTSGEMGGGNYIDGASVTYLSPTEKSTVDCPELPQEFLPIRFGNGLWLGTAGTKIQTVMGMPKINQDVWSYSYAGVKGKYDVTVSLVLKVANFRMKCNFE